MRRSTPVGSRGARARGCRAGYQVRLPLELQSGFAGGGSDRRDAPVVEVAATVEDDLVDTGGLGPLGQEGADLGGRVLVAGGAAAQVGLERRGRGDRATRAVVDHLGGDVLVRSEHREAGPSGVAEDLLADPAMAPEAGLALVMCADGQGGSSRSEEHTSE